MIYMLVEKRYPLTPPTTTDMLNKKLQVDYSVKWHISFLNFSQNSLRINEVLGSILLVVSEQDKLPSSVELDFRARLDGGRMYSGHLEAK
ncbi:hypothetical protein Tco_1235631 [Tanacetum coccineum]